MENLPNLDLYYAEIIIFLGSLVCIVFGAFLKKNSFKKVSFLSFITLFASLSFIFFSNNSFENSNNFYINSNFTNNTLVTKIANFFRTFF